MPLIEVELIEDVPKRFEPDAQLVQRLVDAVGAALESRPGGTWLRLRSLPRNQYAENSDPLPAAVRPVFVRIILADLPELDERRRQAQAVAIAVAEVLDRPSDNTHVIFESAGRGRVAFGGQLLE